MENFDISAKRDIFEFRLSPESGKRSSEALGLGNVVVVISVATATARRIHGAHCWVADGGVDILWCVSSWMHSHGRARTALVWCYLRRARFMHGGE